MTDRDQTSGSDVTGLSKEKLICALGRIHGPLLTAGVTSIRLEYEATKSIGDINYLARNSFGDIVTAQLIDDVATDAAAFVILLLEHRHPSWHSGAGAYGRIDWDLTKNDLVHKHHQRTVTIMTTEHRGL